MDTDVLIVGGGLAGLTAARLLHRSGIDFRLLEARDRLGGRILSAGADGNPSADGFDLGPSWFWPAAQPAMAALVADLGLPVLVVSQFTLYADTRKGRRPTWDAAAPGPVAEPLVAIVADELRSRGAHVETGQFGADMRVSLVNDGPTTIIIDVD